METVGHTPEAPLEARERILRAAIRLFAEQGLHATTTRQIAHEANVNLSLISYYFGGKESLYQTAIREHSQRLEQAMNEVLGPAAATTSLTRESFVGAIDNLLSHTIQEHIDNPEMTRILSAEVNAGMPHSLELFNSVFDRVTRGIAELVDRAQKAGVVRQDVDPYFYVTLLVRAVDGYFVFLRGQTRLAKERLPQVPQDKSRILDQMKLVFVEGVLAT